MGKSEDFYSVASYDGVAKTVTMSERSRDTEATLVKKPHVLMGYLSVRA